MLMLMLMQVLMLMSLQAILARLIATMGLAGAWVGKAREATAVMTIMAVAVGSRVCEVGCRAGWG
jgi:hypothetical protein